MSCQTSLNIARDLVIGAAGGLASAVIMVGVASALNGGFFTAPGAPVFMFIAAGLAGAAFVALGTAFVWLQRWANDGCLSRDCEGKFQQILSALAGAMTLVATVVAGCLSIGGIAWIPWVALAPMIALDVAMALAAANLGLLALLWGPLGECQERVAKARGALEPGEKTSDPWFLRIKPKIQPSYARSVNATLLQDDAVHSQWLECRLYSVREWEVGAIAYIIGAPAPPVSFNWTLAGKAVPASTVQTAGTTSTLTLKSPPLSATAALMVTATDASGFSRTRSVDVDLTSTKLSCHLVLHFVPPMYELPSGPPGPVEITQEMDSLLLSIKAAMQRGTPT